MNIEPSLDEEKLDKKDIRFKNAIDKLVDDDY